MKEGPGIQRGPRPPITIPEDEYRRILKDLEYYKTQTKEDLKQKAKYSSRVELGWDEHVDKWSMIQFILERSYGMRTLEAFFKMWEAEKEALKTAKRKARREARREARK